MSARPSERHTRALALLERLESGTPGRVAENLDDFHPEAVEILLGFAFTDVVAREGASTEDPRDVDCRDACGNGDGTGPA